MVWVYEAVRGRLISPEYSGLKCMKFRIVLGNTDTDLQTVIGPYVLHVY